MQTLQLETGSVAEALFRHLAYIEAGQISKYSMNIDEELKDCTGFYKQLAPRNRMTELASLFNP